MGGWYLGLQTGRLLAINQLTDRFTTIYNIAQMKYLLGTITGIVLSIIIFMIFRWKILALIIYLILRPCMV